MPWDRDVMLSVLIAGEPHAAASLTSYLVIEYFKSIRQLTPVISRGIFMQREFLAAQYANE
jgi:hypothetical protein